MGLSLHSLFHLHFPLQVSFFETAGCKSAINIFLICFLYVQHRISPDDPPLKFRRNIENIENMDRFMDINI